MNQSVEPRVGLIAMVGVVSVVTLVVIRTGLVSYFDRMFLAEQYTKIGSLKPEALLNARGDEKQRLSSGPMPIEKAMQQLAVKGRMGAGPEVMPTASRDVAALQGWTNMPGEVPAAMMAPEAPPAAPSASAAASASAAPSGSAAAPNAPRPAGSGAPRKP